MNPKKARILAASVAYRMRQRHGLSFLQEATLREMLKSEIDWGLLPMDWALMARAEEMVKVIQGGEDEAKPTVH